MASIEDVKKDLSDIKVVVGNVAGDVDSLIEQVAALKAQLESGTLVTQADIDALAQSAQDIKDTLTSIDSKEPPTA